MNDRHTDTGTPTDGAAREFLEEVRAIGEDYERDGREICARFEAVKKECADKVEAASTEKWNDTRRLNADCRALIAATAQSRMTRAKHPEAIKAAWMMLDATIGGACHDSIIFNMGAAEAAMIAVIDGRRRREREADEAEQTT